MSLSENLRLAGALPSSAALSASVCVSVVAAITAPACVRAHASRQANTQNNCERYLAPANVAPLSSEARQQWLTDTCRHPPQQEIFAGCTVKNGAFCPSSRLRAFR